MKFGLVIDVVMGNIFWKYTEWLWGMGPKSRPFLVKQGNAINQKPNLMSFFTALKKCTKTIKNS